MDTTAHIRVNDVTLRYGDFLIQQRLDFSIRRGEIFVIMGGSGCGKTTAMRSIIGLKEPAEGDILIRQRQSVAHGSG